MLHKIGRRHDSATNSVVPPSYDPSVPARLAVLEEIAASTREILRDMRAERAEMRQAFREDQ
jgi:hypothetical protein